jgi:hypothetical protein
MAGFNTFPQSCNTICGTNTFVQPKICGIDFWKGRINALSFIPCADAPLWTEADLGNIVNWQNWYDATTGTAVILKGGYGQVGQNAVTKEDGGDCEGDETAEIQYKLDWTQKKFDLVDLTHHDIIDALLQGGSRSFNLVAHYCKKDMILPIGKFTFDFQDDTHSSDALGSHETKFGFIWTPIKLSIPRPIIVTGISAIIK